MTAKLDAMSPLKVLSRGYAMVQDEDGIVVRSLSQVEPGNTVNISLSDGNVSATVVEKKEYVK